jgi:hypothetical protein
VPLALRLGETPDRDRGPLLRLDFGTSHREPWPSKTATGRRVLVDPGGTSLTVIPTVPRPCGRLGLTRHHPANGVRCPEALDRLPYRDREDVDDANAVYARPDPGPPVEVTELPPLRRPTAPTGTRNPAKSSPNDLFPPPRVPPNHRPARPMKQVCCETALNLLS